MNASEITNAADALQREVLRLQSFADAAKKLVTLGSIEQAVEDANKRLAKARAEEAALEEAIAKLKDGHQTVNKLMDDQKAAHKANLQAMNEAADARAKGLTDAATADAKKITDAAQERSKALVSAAQAQADAIAKDAQTMKQAIAKAHDELGALKVEYQDLTDKIAKARAAAANILAPSA